MCPGIGVQTLGLRVSNVSWCLRRTGGEYRYHERDISGDFIASVF